MNDKVKYILCGFIQLIIAFRLQSQFSVLNLDSILNYIEKNQPELKIYDAKIKAYDTYATGARSLDAPMAGAGFFMTPYNVQMWKSDPMSNSRGMGSFMISAQQMFQHPKKLNANLNYMQSMSRADAEMKNNMRNELFSMAKMNYNDWILLKKKIKVLEESEVLLNYLVKSAEVRYTYGMDKLNAYYKAKGMLADIELMKIMAEQEVKQKMIQLNTLMNRDKNFSFDVDTSFIVKNYESVTTDTATIGMVRSDYRMLKQNENILRSKQLLEQSKRLPDFSIKYDHMIAFGTQPQQFSLMAMVSIPVVPWSSKMYKSSVAGLNYEAEALRNQRQSLLNEINGTIENLKVQIKSKKQQIALSEKIIIPSMKKNYDIALFAYEQNTGELFMALDAWQNLKLSQLSYLDQVMNLLALQTEYEKQLEIK